MPRRGHGRGRRDGAEQPEDLHGHPVGVATLEQPVVYVASIGFEQPRAALQLQRESLALRNRLADDVQHLQQTPKDCRDRIGQGQSQGEDRWRDHDGARGRSFGGQQRAAAEQEADRQAPGITEEDPRRVDVVKQKAEGRPGDQRHQSEHDELPVDRRDGAQSRGGDRRDTGA